MSSLKDESKLYAELSGYYDNNEGDITLKFYKDAINIARKYDKEEIQFVLFSLKYVNGDMETGIGRADSCLNVGKNFFNTLVGKNLKLAFIYSVLEVAQSE